jgi:hypothetical protein
MPLSEVLDAIEKVHAGMKSVTTVQHCVKKSRIQGCYCEEGLELPEEIVPELVAMSCHVMSVELKAPSLHTNFL